ncbi:leucyl aminopeptidase [Corynebacterium propinquum]|uniref:leucyl aminopeptidase n=1 Tax=Corynebacterium propinquum TaxID=43769 RepID=UPI002542E9B0|nr:leucyl aminopeptidase [Corynebacterium propinquum]MDK4252401.1 leucyl aminopeptidase [Corynebacterium propinquum]
MADKKFELPARGKISTVELNKKFPKKSDGLVVGVFHDDNAVEAIETAWLGGSLLREVNDALATVKAKGTANEITRLPAPKKLDADVIIAVGLGSRDKLDDEVLRRAAGSVSRAVKDLDSVSVALSDHREQLAPVVEGLILGSYSYPGIRGSKDDGVDKPEDKKNKSDKDPAAFTMLGDPKKDAEIFRFAQVGAESVCLARDFVNVPSSHKFPESYASFIRGFAEDAGLKVEVLDEKQLEKEGFGGILAVGQGSVRPPRLVRLHHRPRKAKKKVALVGKGITFDTGGISLKPGAGMGDMIMDMGGSAAVVAATVAAAKLDINVELTTTVPLAENMPSGNAIRPGDVITHYGGITSEILNTDAEGRIVLADAIARASEDKPDYLVEAATLTGHQMLALGKQTYGVMGSDELRDRIAELGRTVGEKAWAMALLEEHAEAIKTPAADIRNISEDRWGGMQFAGTYLSQFVGAGIEWAHLDIAGPAWAASASGYTAKRATGVPVRTLVAWLNEVAS